MPPDPASASETGAPPGHRGAGATDAPSTTPAAAREAVARAARGTRLTSGQIDELVLGVSEVVANAHLHGAPPVRIVIAAQPEHVEVRVSDAGRGPDHLDVALAVGDACPVPADAAGGRGLWLAKRSCDEVELIEHDAGCTVRIVVRAVRH